VGDPDDRNRPRKCGIHEPPRGKWLGMRLPRSRPVSMRREDNVMVPHGSPRPFYGGIDENQRARSQGD
jgi:hypothetical protein